jgi:hypothetical protein
MIDNNINKQLQQERRFFTEGPSNYLNEEDQNYSHSSDEIDPRQLQQLM